MLLQTGIPLNPGFRVYTCSMYNKVFYRVVVFFFNQIESQYTVSHESSLCFLSVTCSVSLYHLAFCQLSIAVVLFMFSVVNKRMDTSS